MLDKVLGFQVTATWGAATKEVPYDLSPDSEAGLSTEFGLEKAHFVGIFPVSYAPLSKAELDASEEDTLALMAESELLYASDEL